MSLKPARENSKILSQNKVLKGGRSQRSECLLNRWQTLIRNKAGRERNGIPNLTLKPNKGEDLLYRINVYTTKSVMSYGYLTLD